MKFDEISYTSFLYVLVINFSPLIFAPWVFPPNKPEDLTIEKTCPEWIEFSGFTLDNYNENRKRTLERIIAFDEEVSVWAAIYAFRIGGEKKLPKLLPGQFCKSLGENMDTIKYTFSALNEENRTCHGWILLYGFSKDNHEYNITYAENQRSDKIYAVSIWAYSFYKFVKTWKTQFPTTPIAFCNKMGMITDENAKPKMFINVYGPYITCKAWLELYDYEDDLDKNYNKAQRLYEAREIDFNIQMEAHYIPRFYTSLIERMELSDVKENNMTPLQFCRDYISMHDPARFGFAYEGQQKYGRLTSKRKN